MSRIKPLKRQNVPEVEPFLSATEKRMGFVPNSQLIMAYKPKLLQAFSQLSQAVHDPANRTPPQLRTLVAHMASKSAGCQYCVAHTGESAHNANVGELKIAAVGEYETSTLFSEAERDASLEEVLAVVRLFQWLLPGLLINVAFFRHQLDVTNRPV